MSLETERLASKLEFGPQGWDLSFKAGIWALKGVDRRRRRKRRRRRNLPYVALEKDQPMDLNSSDFALKSNPTACKKESLRPNANFYNPGNGTGG